MQEFTVQGMNSVEGTQLVQRLVEAGAKMIIELDATFAQAEAFVAQGLSRIAENQDFAEADSADVREDAVHLLELLGGVTA